MPRKEYRQLTHEEEREHFRRLHENNDQEARAVLAESIIPWAEHLAIRYCRRHNWDDLDEAISAAYLGIVWSVDHYDPQRGTRLTTFSQKPILHCIQRAYERKSLITIAPGWTGAKFLNKHAASHAHKIKSINYEYRGKEKQIDVECGTGDPAVIAAMRDFSGADRLLSCLDPRSREIITRIVFHGDKDRQIARDLRISKQRVYQIKEKAFAKLRRWHWRLKDDAYTRRERTSH